MNGKEQAAFSRLGAALDDAVQLGYVGIDPQTQNADVVRARRRVVGEYLFLLGYLAKRPADDTRDRSQRTGDLSRSLGHDSDGDIREAVRNFQRDAGLTADGWVGPETWDAVQQLASFEYPTDVTRWISGEKQREVLWRAVYLRLFAFGLTKLPPRPNSRLQSKQEQTAQDISEGLGDFVRAVAVLQPSAPKLEPALVRETVSLLFDQHAVCALVKVYLDNPAWAPKQKQNLQLIKSFLCNTARIELWLYGYNVDIGNFKRKGPFFKPDRFTQSFDSAMQDFCSDHGKEKAFCARSQREESDVLGWFFAHLVALRLDLPDLQNPEDADRVVERVLADEKTMTGVRGAIKSLGARLWDGVTRAWNWIKSVFKKVVTTVKRVAKRVITNISRFVHGAALKVFSHVVAAIKAVVDGVDFLKEKIVRGSDPEHMVVFHDKDWDFEVFVNASADPAVVDNLTERIALRCEVFAVGGKIVGNLLSIFLSTLRNGVTTGWFALMLAFVRIFKSVKQLRAFSQRALTLMTELDGLRAQA
ncbi:peptidoglycan-binding protein [Pelagibius sp. Alg239-R121]|uniref:peptidoglycan-binding protein n=1 Tax=Pelagibius sp. Alg239-R121 TaxID=2993448 RepID=UPI0024A72DB2|nr:peptidoglycan-binding domain-containing protein [Pelagibius sp. Alg239-R121]